jgi:DHA3 family macrolide efflux protein-like MFS transporter
MGIGQEAILWGIASFVFMAVLPLVNASSQAIWQSKVPPDVQGKVFAARSVIASISSPLAMIIGGLLADYVFEPAMRSEGWLAPIFGSFVGTGSGAGIGLLYVFLGIGTALIGVIGYSIPNLREVESRVPDFDAEMVEAAA